MVLSSKKVIISSEGLDWTQNLLQSHHHHHHHQTLDHQFPKQQPLIRRQQHNQSEPLKCPRCDSSNTKFCYYNNYNKSQPRHFCKSCKRHWTKGGTLRNVPVGGGRKNKSHKSSKTTTISTAVTTAAAATTSTNHNVNIINRVNSHPPLPLGGQKNLSEILYRAGLISPASASASSSSALQQNSISNNSNGVLFGSNLSVPQTHDQGLNFPYPNPFQSSNVCEYTGEPLEDSTITTTTTSTVTLPWQAPNTNFWNWDDIDNLVSTTDLNIPWNDDTEIKP